MSWIMALAYCATSSSKCAKPGGRSFCETLAFLPRTTTILVCLCWKGDSQLSTNYANHIPAGKFNIYPAQFSARVCRILLREDYDCLISRQPSTTAANEIDIFSQCRVMRKNGKRMAAEKLVAESFDFSSVPWGRVRATGSLSPGTPRLSNSLSLVAAKLSGC